MSFVPSSFPDYFLFQISWEKIFWNGCSSILGLEQSFSFLYIFVAVDYYSNKDGV